MSSKLTAYSYLWNKFVKGIISMDEKFRPAANCMNDLCKNLLANYPHYPKFSIWRLMVKIWHKEVFQPTKNILNKVFLRLLLNHRITTLLEMKNDEGKTFLDSMPANFFKLSKLNEKSVFEDFKSFFQKNAANQTKVRQVLQNFAASVADISFDECSVHYIGHTKVSMGRPYQKLENGLIKQTKKIYLNLHPTKQGKKHFQQFFSEDCKLIALLFLNKTYNIFFNYVSGIAINTMDKEIRAILKSKKS